MFIFFSWTVSAFAHPHVDMCVGRGVHTRVLAATQRKPLNLGAHT